MPERWRAAPHLRRLTATALALGWAGFALLAGEAGAAVCPSYPTPLLCNQPGYCVTVDASAHTLTSDIPGRAQVEDLEPVDVAQQAMSSATGASAGANGTSESGAGVLRTMASGGASAAGSPPDGTANLFQVAVLRAPDLVFTGPGPMVEATLHLVLAAGFAASASASDDEQALAGVALTIDGALCSGSSEYVAFTGARRYNAQDFPGSSASAGYTTNLGVLMDVPLAGTTAIDIGPFQVPTGQPLQLELRIAPDLGVTTGGGMASASTDFELGLGDGAGGPVFDLPAGYSVDSATAGIADNQLPEPAGGGGAALLALAALARRAGVRPARRSGRRTRSRSR